MAEGIERSGCGNNVDVYILANGVGRTRCIATNRDRAMFGSDAQIVRVGVDKHLRVANHITIVAAAINAALDGDRFVGRAIADNHFRVALDHTLVTAAKHIALKNLLLLDSWGFVEIV